MTSPTDPNSSSDPFLQYLASLSAAPASSTTAQPKVNSQGQLDIFGLGDNSGVEFPVGTTSQHNVDKTNYGGLVNQTDTNSPSSGQLGTSVTTTTPDEYLTSLMHLSQTDPSAFIAIQSALYGAGYYGNVKPTEVSWGRWSARTKDALVGKAGALTDYLEMYKSGATTDVFGDWVNKQLDAAKKDPYSLINGGGANTPTGPAFKGTSPEDIALQGNSESQGLLGRSLSPDEQNQLVTDTTNQQHAAFDQGDVYVRSVTPQAVERQTILQGNTSEYAQHQAEGYANAFANMFLSGPSSRANTTVGDAAVTSG